MPLVPPIPRNPDGSLPSATEANHKFFLKERVAFKATPSACLDCKATDKEHYANNLCMTCYNRAKMKAWRSKANVKKKALDKSKSKV